MIVRLPLNSFELLFGRRDENSLIFLLGFISIEGEEEIISGGADGG